MFDDKATSIDWLSNVARELREAKKDFNNHTRGEYTE